MAVRNPLLSSAAAISFAHLQGVTVPPNAGARGRRPRADDGGDTTDEEDPKKQREGESDEDYAKRMEEEGDGAGDDADDGDGDETADGEDGDPGDSEDAPKDKKDAKSKAAYARGMKAERSRWAAVLGNKSFASNPALGARLLATTALPAKTILGCLRDSPAAGANHPQRAAGNPNIGPSGASTPTGPAAIEQRWGAAFKRAGILK